MRGKNVLKKEEAVCIRCNETFVRNVYRVGAKQEVCTKCRKEYLKTYNKIWKKSHPERTAKHKETYLSKPDKKAAAVKHLADFKALWKMRQYFDSDHYAKVRRLEREHYIRRTADKRTKNYRPRYSFRIPDWSTKGENIIDANSPFLKENLTPAMKAYSLELYKERKQQRIRLKQI